jgi:hypothetical protein
VCALSLLPPALRARRPVNLPPGMDTIPGIAAAMARSHSYDWVLAAAEAPETDEEDGALVAL